MNRDWNDAVNAYDPVRDVELAEALAEIDPGTREPNYWLRFRVWVMSSAARELARRRLMAQLTVGEVVRSWAGAVVPTALLAAVLAGLLLLRSGVLSQPQPIGVEELLVSEVQGETIPTMLGPDTDGETVAFASEAF